jgi:hypothetical protein
MSPGSLAAHSSRANGRLLAAYELESLVEHQLNRILSDKAQLADWIHEWVTPANILPALDRADELVSHDADDDPRSRRSTLPIRFWSIWFCGHTAVFGS